MDYKETLNLPKTDFPMKANLPSKEPHILEVWRKNVWKIMRKGFEGDKFVLHDGPPYANGHIHIGHALNKILKDVIVKYNLMTGKGVDYVPGWDCHGLPIEREVEKELKKKGRSKEDVTKSEFRAMCREYAKRFVEIQREEFMRLGVLANWDEYYLTMDPSYEADELRELYRFLEKGLLYRSKKPVYWCIYDRTAEAEAEVEYRERQDPSVYVKFKVSGEENLYLVIWTTTPWTLPANLGVMVGEDYTYVYLDTGGDTLVIAKDLIENFTKQTGINGRIVRELKGRDLIGISYAHPFVERSDLEDHIPGDVVERIWKVYGSEFVDLSSGTGLVHMAPGHGSEDYVVGRRYGIEPYAPVDDSGRFVEPAPEFLRGKRVFEANELILERLSESGHLLYRTEVSHSYPHCWRCKNPVIFRATEQWFISMEGKVNSETLREKALGEIEKVRWFPDSGKIRIRSMVEQRPDWCISRQRFWGVPIAILYCKNCGEVVSDKEVLEGIARLVEKSESASDVWFGKEAGYFLPEGFRCYKCGGREFGKEEDILDVWFDSGCSHVPVLKKRGIEKADLYLEGSDQHRGWFQASLLESVGSYGEAPYRAVLTHGFTVDEKGRKMSKSVGNVVSPQEVIKDYGADILRLWVVSEDYTEDVKLGKGILRNITEDYKKIRNTVRFLLANLYDFDPATSMVQKDAMHHFDRWMLSVFNRLLMEIHEHYRSYTFYRVYHSIRNFCAGTLSSLYLDVVKDRLYVYGKDSWERRSAQSVIYKLAVGIITSIAPFLSFTAEEAWFHLRKIDSSLPESVFMSHIPEVDEGAIDESLEKDYSFLLTLRREVMKAIEEARSKGVLKHPYEAKVYIHDSSIREKISGYLDYLNYFLTVSQVEFGEGGKVVAEAENIDGLRIGISFADGKKCPRCWIYFPEDHFCGDVCERCCGVLEKG